MRLFPSLVFSFCVGWISCGKPSSPTPVSSAFYHWKSAFEPTPPECATLAALGTSKIYLRLFDVDWDDAVGQPLPLAELQSARPQQGQAIIPTIFITNRTLEKISLADCDSLSVRICSKMMEMTADFFPGYAPEEWQFDCDWTRGTRARYFHLLEASRKFLKETRPAGEGVKISATIRLHQVKFSEVTGVPPVDRGMLMCYNMGDVDDPTGGNSILDPALAARYFDRLNKYPLPLDVALPLFSWAAVYRDGNLVFLANNRRADDLADTTLFSQIAENQFLLKNETWLDGFPVYAADFVKIESPAPADLEKMADLLSSALKKEAGRTLAFYHLDSVAMSHFDPGLLKRILEKLEP